MKTAQGLALGGSILLISAAGAHAADLPVSRVAPVEYVRVCSSQGTGFFSVPGTDTCLKISGFLRADYIYLQPRNTNATPNSLGNGRDNPATAALTRARLEVDTRTNTEYGVLRTFVRYQIDKHTGSHTAGAAPILNKAYIQWAGFTAGYALSFFDFYATAINWGSFGGSLGSERSTNLLAYTATFGKNFSATISLEDRNLRNTNANYYEVAGQRMPDVVTNLHFDQKWGNARLSAALHQMNSKALYGIQNNRVNTIYGWAVQGGTKLHLPMTGARDALWFQAAYADGAMNYLGLNGSTSIGKVSTTVADGYLVDGKIKKTTGWNALAAGVHYWTPRIRSTLWSSYTSVKYSSDIKRNNALFRDFNIWQVGSALIWSPSSKLNVGAEVLYGHLQRHRYNAIEAQNAARVKHSEGSIQARLRLQRDF